MKALKTAGRILSAALTAVLELLFVCNLYLMIARSVTGKQMPTVFGFSSAIVVSGSMSGSIEIGDIVLVHREESYAPGDVISFEHGRSVVTHRIVGTAEEGYITRGDANNADDSDPVPAENIIGRVILVIPKIGGLVEFLRTPLGMTCLVLAGVILIELPSLTERIRAKKTGGSSHE